MKPLNCAPIEALNMPLAVTVWFGHLVRYTALNNLGSVALFPDYPGQVFPTTSFARCSLHRTGHCTPVSSFSPQTCLDLRNDLEID